jgi:RHS repeat-associated protein
LTPGITNFFTSRDDSTNASRPKAYLNWVLFDEQFRFVSAGSGAEQVPDESAYNNGSSTPNVYTHVKTNLPITNNGYLYIYVSNETPNIDVFFDNLQVTHTRGPLLEETHYYPFGLTIAGISSRALKTNYVENKYKYNDGTERTTDWDLNWDETEFRSYDPQIGRFLQIDELSNLNFDYSPYVYANNNPISLNDPYGLSAESLIDPHKHGFVKNDPNVLKEVVVTAKKNKPSTVANIIDVATDFVPLVSGGKDIYKGIRDGNGWQVAAGLGSIVLDIFTFGGASIEKGIVKTAIKEGSEYIAKETTEEIVTAETRRFLLNEGINVTEDGFIHVMQRHYPRSGMFLGKSKFTISVREIVDMIKNSAQVPKVLQRGGNFQRVVDAGRIIGVDAITGEATSKFTIITNKAGDLITSFPGLSGR